MASVGITFATDNFGANPIDEIIRHFGKWTLIFICLTLSITPLRRMTKSNIWLPLRKMLGLFTFFYASIHLFSFIGLDHHFDWNFITQDLIKKRYAIVGFIAWILLIPLAITSTQKMKRLLKEQWFTLHKLIYVIAVLGVIHYVWLVKKDMTQPIIYGVILAILLLLRFRFKKN
jgi:sulfoxide reductase heme-binding subunit YedZ